MWGAKVFFSQKPDRKSCIMVINKNNIINISNIIPTADREAVSNRDMVGIATPQQTFLSMDLNPEKKDSSIAKEIILVKNYSRRSISRSIETFCRSLDENNTGSQNFDHSKRIQNSISFKTFSVKSYFPTNSELRRGVIGETGGKRNVKEGGYQKSSTITSGVCKQSTYFLSKRRMGTEDQL